MYDAIVIGAGLSGLAAAALLAKRGYKTAVVESSFKPGGSCGIFKRKGAIFEQGAAMLYGFGEQGFNAHRFLYNQLEIPIELVRHKELYSVYFKGKRIRFYYDIDKYINELADIFPDDLDNFRRFYADIKELYSDVIAETPVYSTPNHANKKAQLLQVKKHPKSYLKFLSLMNKSTYDLLKKYFENEEVFYYFNKLTSTYCYTDVKETPAVMAAVMFVDNHTGGSYYPVGSTIFATGLLEKYIEEHGGEMIYDTEVRKIIVKENKVCGVETDKGEIIASGRVIFSGTVWNLYGKLLDENAATVKKRNWAMTQKASYPSVILYALVKKEAIPDDTSPITLFTGREEMLDENEVTAYILSLDEPNICPAGYHCIEAIGPTFENWPKYTKDYSAGAEYRLLKEREESRLVNLMEHYFPGFRDAIVYKEIATPLTIEKYTLKNNGSVAGPLQSMGQHMLKRLGIKTSIGGLYCCGESTIMGTGTPAVTVSGITACNVILKEDGKPAFEYEPGKENFVRIMDKNDAAESAASDEKESLASLASECQYCEFPTCMKDTGLDIRGINRRLCVGNVYGAKKALHMKSLSFDDVKHAQANCVLNKQEIKVQIVKIMTILGELE